MGRLILYLSRDFWKPRKCFRIRKKSYFITVFLIFAEINFLEFRVKDDVDTYCCYADQGIGVILKRKNRNRLNLSNVKFSKFNFNEFAQNYLKYLNIIEYEDLIKIVENYE